MNYERVDMRKEEPEVRIIDFYEFTLGCGPKHKLGRLPRKKHMAFDDMAHE